MMQIMKHALIVLLALTGCSQTTVTEMGANRFRVTVENTRSAGTAETMAAEAARSYCTARGMTAEIAGLANQSRGALMATPQGALLPYTIGAAGADFSCKAA